eukprot:1187322-Amphidinium_carterae.1
MPHRVRRCLLYEHHAAHAGSSTLLLHSLSSTGKHNHKAQARRQEWLGHVGKVQGELVRDTQQPFRMHSTIQVTADSAQR